VADLKVTESYPPWVSGNRSQIEGKSIQHFGSFGQHRTFVGCKKT